jgi:hypothetical protein
MEDADRIGYKSRKCTQAGSVPDPGSGFHQVSGSVFGIRIQEGKNNPQKYTDQMNTDPKHCNLKDHQSTSTNMDIYYSPRLKLCLAAGGAGTCEPTATNNTVCTVIYPVPIP